MQALAELSGLQNLETLNITYNLVHPQGLALLDNSERLQNLGKVKTDTLKAED
ncbi:MAG: hypothetical protein Ct9H300mP23_07060 [Nitrospinota bacterium]|nr:MAG: hypothetical protein Ct9H300mP23_07060 [Nitrospinota bacterium]